MSDTSDRAVSVPNPNINYQPTAWEIEAVRKLIGVNTLMFTFLNLDKPGSVK
jgi:hypothetical protein